MCPIFQVTRAFLKDSVYYNMTPLFVGSVVMLVSKEPKAKELLMTLRASPQMTLLGTFTSWIYQGTLVANTVKPQFPAL